MNSIRRPRPTALAWASALALAAVLSACGGGGGDGDDAGPPGTIDLSLANRDTAAHAAAAAALGLGGTDQLLNTASASTLVQREVAQALRGLRERPLGLIGPIDEPCLVSGISRMTIDDTNNNGYADLNELVTIQFIQCKDSADETVDGGIGVTLTQMSSESSFGGNITLDALTVVLASANQQHSTRLDGPMRMTYTESSPTVASFRLTASAPVTVTVSTPVFNDAVTLSAGFMQEAEIDVAALPPSGATTTPGRTTTRSSGRIASQAAGGEVTVVTTQPLVQYLVDPFPRSGRVDISGRTGSVGIQTLSTDEVQIDLDSNGDGAVDATTLQRWDWLI
jgi:hypothetical protein